MERSAGAVARARVCLVVYADASFEDEIIILGSAAFQAPRLRRGVVACLDIGGTHTEEELAGCCREELWARPEAPLALLNDAVDFNDELLG